MIEYSKDIILNTNLSLKRNIEGFDFPTSMSEEDSQKIISYFREIYEDELILVQEVDENTLNKFINDGILSEDYDTKLAQIGLVIKNDHVIVINDKDHISINIRNFNMDLKAAFKTINLVEEFLDEKFDFAFSPEYGYLTSDARNTGLGYEISYKLFLFGLLDSDQTYIALKSALAHEGMYFTKFVPKYYKKFSKDVYLLKNFGNYRQNVDQYIEKIESSVDTIIRNERRFRRDYQALNRISDEDIFENIKIIETNLKSGNLRSLETITSALYGLKKYNCLGFRTQITNNDIDYLIFNVTKNKYKGDRDNRRYEFLNSYMEANNGK